MLEASKRSLVIYQLLHHLRDMATSDQDEANQEVSVFQRRKKSDSKCTQSDPRQREMSLWRVLQWFWQYQKNTDSNILTFKERIYVYTSLKENFGGKSKRKKERERERNKGRKKELVSSLGEGLKL